MIIKGKGSIEDLEKVLEDAKNRGEEKEEAKEESLKDEKNDDEEQDDHISVSSPRGVLETSLSSPQSDHSTTTTTAIGSERSNSSITIASEKPDPNNNNNNNDGMLWKNLFDQIKKRSFKKFPAIPFLGGGNDFSRSLKRRFRRNPSADDAAIDCGVPKPSWRSFTYQELVDATDNFNPDNLVGQGGHAEVYKGRLPDGQIVAVKKITDMEKDTEDRGSEFLSELGIIAHVNHPNAAKLIGFSVDSGLHLVLQYIPHGSLATILHDSSEGMAWKIRYRVAVGVAEGLKYLHCDCPRRIIHRDITASNILMTEDYKPQISDFGLAKWLPEKWTHHQVSPIEGTFGYMAPEYFMHGIVHEKTDVFAFGVLLLELITGRHAVSCNQSLAMWAKPLLQEKNVKGLVDPRLGGKYDTVEMRRAMSTASSCLHHLPDMRPNMKKVVQSLKGECVPADIRIKSIGGRALLVDACDLEDYTSATYLNDLNRHKQLIME